MGDSVSGASNGLSSPTHAEFVGSEEFVGPPPNARTIDMDTNANSLGPRLVLAGPSASPRSALAGAKKIGSILAGLWGRKPKGSATGEPQGSIASATEMDAALMGPKISPGGYASVAATYWSPKHPQPISAQQAIGAAQSPALISPANEPFPGMRVARVWGDVDVGFHELNGVVQGRAHFVDLRSAHRPQGAPWSEKGSPREQIEDLAAFVRSMTELPATPASGEPVVTRFRVRIGGATHQERIPYPELYDESEAALLFERLNCKGLFVHRVNRGTQEAPILEYWVVRPGTDAQHRAFDLFARTQRGFRELEAEVRAYHQRLSDQQAEAHVRIAPVSRHVGERAAAREANPPHMSRLRHGEWITDYFEHHFYHQTVGGTEGYVVVKIPAVHQSHSAWNRNKLVSDFIRGIDHATPGKERVDYAVEFRLVNHHPFRPRQHTELINALTQQGFFVFTRPVAQGREYRLVRPRDGLSPQDSGAYEDMFELVAWLGSMMSTSTP